MNLRCLSGAVRCWMLGLAIGVMFSASGFSIVTLGECAEIVDRIVAVVNDDIILLSELNQEFQPYADRIRKSGYSPSKEREMIEKVRTDILKRLIDQVLTDQEIERTRILVSEKEVDQAFERFKAANNLTDETLERALAEQGRTLESYRLRIKEQILRTRLVNREVKSKIVITKADIRAYYDAHADRYAGAMKYHLRNLMMRISPDTTESEKRVVEKRMNDILTKLKAGQTFDKSGTIGTDLGWIESSKLSPQLRTALNAMTPGEFTPVLDTDQGFQIFFVQDITTIPGKSFEDASGEIETELYDEVVNGKFESWLDNLRGRSHIKRIE